MKILFLTNKPPYPLKDGGAIASFRMIEGMANAGHDVHLLSMKTLKHPVSVEQFPEDFKSRVQISLVDTPAAISASGAFRNLLFSKLPYNAERFINKDFSVVLQGILQNGKFDVVQLEGLYLSFYIELIRSVSSAKIIYRSHNIEHEIWERSLANETNRIKKGYLKILAKRLKRFELSVINQYDLLLPITAKDGDFLSKAGSVKPIHVTPTGFDCSKTRQQTGGALQMLFHIGALDWFPNQEGLIWFFEQVWDSVLAVRPQLQFSVAGRNAPQWFIDKLRTYKNVLYEGEVDNAFAYMKGKQIMLVPLLSGSGMRIKIVEGMALGKSIVTTSIGAEGISAEHGKHIMLADTSESYSAAVLSLLSDENYCFRMGNEAAGFVRQQLDNDNIISEVSSFIEQYI